MHSRKQSPHNQNTSIRPTSQPSYPGDLVSDGWSFLEFRILSMKFSFGHISEGVSREVWLKKKDHLLKMNDTILPTEVLEQMKIEKMS